MDLNILARAKAPMVSAVCLMLPLLPCGAEPPQRWPQELPMVDLAVAGLAHLSPEDQGKVLKLVANSQVTNKRQERAQGPNRALSPSSDILQKIAMDRMEEDGWTPVEMGIIQAGGKDFLVVRRLATTSATSDVPFLLSSLNLPMGKYWAKPAVMGGVSEFIDKNGKVFRLFMPTWTDIH